MWNNAVCPTYSQTNSRGRPFPFPCLSYQTRPAAKLNVTKAVHSLMTESAEGLVKSVFLMKPESQLTKSQQTEKMMHSGASCRLVKLNIFNSPFLELLSMFLCCDLMTTVFKPLVWNFGHHRPVFCNPV